jgi:predicted transcriptional regulator
MALIGGTVADIPFNKNPLNKISLTGSLKKDIYEGRYYAKLLAEENEDIEILQHPGYKINRVKKRNKIGSNFYKYLNSFIAGITSSATVRYKSIVIVSKIFEIPKTGSLLILDKNCESYMEEYGFINKVNYLQYDSKESLKTVINYVLDSNNLDEINKIRKNGYDLVNKKYTLLQTAKFIDQIIVRR